MPEPFTIISLLAAGKAAITGWLTDKGADVVREKVTGLAKDKANEYGKSLLAQFHENAKLHLRQADKSVPKALRLAYLQATLQVCALRSDELGANVTSYSQYITSKLPRWKRAYDEPLGILSRADVQWLDGLHQWLRAEIDNARKGKLPPLEITEQDFADLVPFENDINDKPLRKRLTKHLISEIEQTCPGMPDRFHSLLTEGWDQFDANEQAQRVTWFDCFCVCFQDALAKDPPAREFFQTKLLAGIAHQQRPIDFDQFADALRRLNEQLASRDVSIYFDDLSSQLGKGFVALHDHLDIVAGKVDQVAVRIEESTTQIIHAQNEHTETLLDAIRHGAKPAKSLPPPSVAEVRRYLQELMERTAELPAYYPQRLRQADRTVFDEIRQTVQVVKDRERFQKWAEEERRRAMGQFDDARRYNPNKSRPEMEGYDGERREREQPPEPPMDWEKAAAEYPCAVILGDPGFGKSWLLRYEARRLARQALLQLDAGATLDQIQLPILTRLADVARAAKMRTVTEALAALASRYAQDNALSAAFHTWVVQHLQMGRCAVLLDAWDEVAEAPALPGEVLSRAELAVKLNHFSAPRILFTSRGAGYTGSPIKGAQELELIAFEQSQIEQFARVWFDGEPSGAARFLSLLKAHPAIRGLARIPLMLSLLSRMFTAIPAERFPQSRCEIYEQCLRGLLQDWKEEKQPGVEIEDADAMLEALSALAFAIPIERGAFKRSVLRKQMKQWLGELRKSDSFYGQQAETLIRRLLQDGVLIKANDESDPDYLFLHRTFHEYLTACALAQREGWLEQALQKFYDPAWLQVLILLGGRLETAEQAERYIAALRNEQYLNTFLDRLKFPHWRRYKDIFFRPFLLAVFAAQEARETLSEQTKNKILGETLQYWLEPPQWLASDWFLNALLGWNKRAFPALRALLRDKQVGVRVRRSVVEALAKMQDREALPDILAFLRDKRVNEWVRRPVAEALATMRDREALPDILAFLRDERVDVPARRPVAEALAKMQDREALPEILALLRDERVNVNVRFSVAEALATMRDREALPDILAFLRDEQVDVRVRLSVAEVLATMRDRETLPDILAFLRDERVDVRLRRHVVEAPAKMQDLSFDHRNPRALLHDKRVNKWVRRPVTEALAGMQDREALSDILTFLRNERVDYEVRLSVAEALARMQDREALPDILAFLRDERVNVRLRCSVAEALTGMRDREALPDLRALLRDKRVDSEVRLPVAIALAKMQDREALPEILALLRDERVNIHVRFSVAEALARMQDREALPDILAFLRDERVDVRVRLSVAKALTGMRDREALPDLRALLRDKQVSVRVRRSVAVALAKMRDREALPDLRALLRDERVSEWVRRPVAEALAKMQDREALPEILALLRDERANVPARRPIAEALTTMRDREALPEILALLRDERVDPEVRGLVRDGLWKLAQAEKIPIRFE